MAAEAIPPPQPARRKLMAITTIGNSGNPVPLPAAPQGAPAPEARVSAAVPEPPRQQQSEQVQKAVESLKQLVETVAPNSLAFSIDDSTGKTIVSITDTETGEMIRQIPSEEMLEIARSLDKVQGILLRQKA
jgi:flagellar protein FlaG